MIGRNINTNTATNTNTNTATNTNTNTATNTNVNPPQGEGWKKIRGRFGLWICQLESQSGSHFDTIRRNTNTNANAGTNI